MDIYKVIYHNGQYQTKEFNNLDDCLKFYKEIPKNFAKILLKNNKIANKYGVRVWIDKLIKHSNIFNSFFDRIFVINLDHRTDRWEQVTKQFKQFGITNFERFSACKPEFEKIDKKLYQSIHNKRKDYVTGSIGW